MEIVLRDKGENVEGLLNPATGEIVRFADATREQLAAWYLAMVTWQAQAAAAVRLAGHVFAEMSDREASLSVHVGDKVVSVPGAGSTFEINKSALREGLLELVRSGDLTQKAADDTCRPIGVECPSCGEFVPTEGFKVNQAALNNLRKVPKLRAVIEGCGEYVSRPRPLKSK
jgi:hypothetical protein